jgi:hypothetical protein
MTVYEESSMTDPKPSFAERLEPARRWLVTWLAAVWRRLKHWLGIAARQTWIVLQRLPVAALSFYRALTDGDYHRTLAQLAPGDVPRVSPGSARAMPEALMEPVALQDAGPDAALVLLGLFQKEGRLVDFLQEDVTHYSDQDVGAAARVVHDGCRKVLQDYLRIEPVRGEAEGAQVTLGKGFDPSAVRPTGNVVGEPPFTGALVHRGWRAAEVHLPKVASSRDLTILAAAEVEL